MILEQSIGLKIHGNVDGTGLGTVHEVCNFVYKCNEVILFTNVMNLNLDLEETFEDY